MKREIEIGDVCRVVRVDSDTADELPVCEGSIVRVAHIETREAFYPYNCDLLFGKQVLSANTMMFAEEELEPLNEQEDN